MEKKKQKPYRKYDAQFKSEAVGQVTNGRSVPVVAKALGISDVVLYQWCKKASSPLPNASSSELEVLRKEYKQLETERDILKKALAIFSRTI